MRKTFIVTLITVLAFLASFSVSFSQPVFIENFNYPASDTVANNAGWSLSGFSTQKAKIISPGLTYSGYLGSGSGNCIYLPNAANGEMFTNYFPNFEYFDQGTVYLSFLIRVDSMALNATQGYCIGLDEIGSTNLTSYVYFKKVTANTFNFGIRKRSAISYSSNVYNTNTTYMIVASYTFKPGSSTNDECKLYVFNSGVPVNEPVTPAALDTNGTDQNEIGRVIISNLFNQSGLHGSSVKIDGIRIGTSWTGTLHQNINMNLNLTALIQGFYDNVTDKMVKDTVTVTLRYRRSPYQIAESRKAVLDSTGKGTFTFHSIGNSVRYYIAVTHRNTVESWSSLTNQFFSNASTYNFTTNANVTYGNNVIQKGTKHCFYNGEINHDGIIDVTDYQFVDNNAFAFATGYKTTDLNGDEVTDISDLVIVETNAYNFVQRIIP
ncbi:MAG TPA: hypothetical protein PL089_02395 [Ignavibacteria bacterium]|nr:hypothetical protein [Ignavibacteria bacterium]